MSGVNYQINTQPASEPVSLQELKLHLGLSSGSFSDNIDITQCIPPASHVVTTGYDLYGAGADVLGLQAVVILDAGTNLPTGTVDVKIQESDSNTETISIDVSPASDWVSGDIITGQSSNVTATVVAKLTDTTYTIENRSGVYTLGETIGVTGEAAKLADQGATKPTFSGAGYADWTGGAFAQVTTANDNTSYEKAYTGVKRYIRSVAKTLLASCTFSVSIVRNQAIAADDALLSELITASRISVENDTRRAIVTQTIDYYPAAWPTSDKIKLPLGNLQSVSSIIYKDSNGVETTMAPTTDYLVETNGDKCGYVVLPYGGSWPSTTLFPTKPITITYICGYGDAASVPSTVKQAIKRRCANLYENRGEDTVGGYSLSVIEDKTYKRLINIIPPIFDEEFL